VRSIHVNKYPGKEADYLRS